MVMVFRPPLDPIILLPYYPPGANDPNDPNYDPEAPADGSANPPWWSLPPRPEKPLMPANPGGDPSWMPLPSLIAGMWEDKLMAAYPPMPPKDDGIVGRPGITPRLQGR